MSSFQYMPLFCTGSNNFNMNKYIESIYKTIIVEKYFRIAVTTRLAINQYLVPIRIEKFLTCSRATLNYFPALCSQLAWHKSPLTRSRFPSCEILLHTFELNI